MSEKIINKNITKMSNAELIKHIEALNNEKESLLVACSRAKKVNKVETQVRNSTLKSHMHNSIVSECNEHLRVSDFFVSEEIITETKVKNDVETTKEINVLKVTDEFKDECNKAIIEMIIKHKKD